jgi:hypothetical protein
MGDDHMPDAQALQARTMVGISPLICTTSGPIVAKDLAKQIDARGAQLCALLLKRLPRQRQAHRPHVNAIPRAGLQQCITRIGG